VYERLYHGNPAFGQAEILELLAQRPELNRTEADLVVETDPNGTKEGTGDDN
jgi:hypothetical protein